MTGWNSLSWEAKRGAVLAQALFVCEICHDAEAVEVDHIWPKVAGGTDDRSNLRAACRPCNAKKGDKIWVSDIVADPDLLFDGFIFERRTAEEAATAAVRWEVLHALLREGLASDDADGMAMSAAEQIATAVCRLLDETVRTALTSTVVEAST